MTDGFGTSQSGQTASAARTCAGEARYFITDLPDALVSVTGDGLTPHEGGVALPDSHGARLLTVDGQQQGATTSVNTCVNEIGVLYLADLKIPDSDSGFTVLRSRRSPRRRVRGT